MNIDIVILFKQVVVLILMILPGFFLAKFKLSNELLGKGVSNIVLYAAQPALIVSGFIQTPYDPTILGRMLAVFLFSFVFHILFAAIGFLVFRPAPENKRRVLIFATTFTNAGYMGIPLLKAVIGPEVAIYGSLYIFAFNLFVWSLGPFIYTDEKKYISVKKMVLNPATISALVGIAFFVLSAFDANPFLMSFTKNSVPDIIIDIFSKLIAGLDALVAPLAMLIIGLRLAEVNFSKALRDKWMYCYLAVSMLLTPALAWCLVKLVGLTGLWNDAMTTNVLLLSAAAPAATATSMFAEKFEGDAPYSGVIVSISSIICIATMPLLSLLTYL